MQLNPSTDSNTTVLANTAKRWLQWCILAVSIVMVVLGTSVIVTQPVTVWFSMSATCWMAVLLVASIWQLRGSFTSIALSALATAVVSRLFSTLRLDPPANIAGLKVEDLDRLVATGPGVPGFELLGWLLGALLLAHFIVRAISLTAMNTSREDAVHAVALTFIRIYLGLMFVPHFGSHILGGPFQFGIYTLYFGTLGLHYPALQVLLAGSIELLVSIGLVLGVLTRPIAILGAVYLLLSMLWGGHFAIGYVWALPEGGYEFGVCWAAMIAVFAVAGGGPLSLDGALRQSHLETRWPRLRAARLLFR